MSALTPHEVALIKTSFDAILEQLEQDTDLAQRIYMRLFELAPEARAMFNPNMKLQEEKLVAMLARLVGSLSDKAKFKALTANLGKTHKGYNVQPAHYAVLKQAIVLAFADVAPASFNPPTVAAWSKAYDAIAEAMMSI